MSIKLILPQRAIELFWNKVNKTDTCWLWTGATNKGGYGQFSFIIKGIDEHETGINVPIGRLHFNKMAHRVAFYLANNRWPAENLELSHTCHNPACVNISHLEEVSHIKNMERSSKDKRLVFGENNSSAKLTETLVKELYNKYISGGITATQLAKDFNVSIATVLSILKGKKWKYLNLAPIKNIQERANNITEKQVIEIYSLYKEGKSQPEIAKIYGIVPSTVHFIVSGKIYKHLNLEPIIGVNRPKKLTDQQVWEIYQSALDGTHYKDLAQQYKVSMETIRGVCIGKYYKHLNLTPILRKPRQND